MPQSNSKEYHPAPEWLTKAYVQDKLQKRYKDFSLRVSDLDIKPATAKGENYASVMTRIRVEFSSSQGRGTKAESFLVKTAFEGDGPAAVAINSYGVYQREMHVYEQVLPQLAALMKEIGDTDKLYAETVHVDYEHSAIIFEDLSVSDYVMANRIARLDMDHAKLVLNKLAKIHATSVVLHKRQPDIFAHNYDVGIFNRHTEGLKPLIIGNLTELARFVQSNSDLKKYHSKILALRCRIMEYGARAYDLQESQGHFNTLVHGDFWTNNMMFKYGENGTAVDVIPIDYQFAGWNSPAVDLQYFFNSSLREELRLHHQPELLQYYYGVLAETLSALKFTGRVPSLYNLCIQMEMRGFLGLAAALIFQPIMLCEETEDADFNNLLVESESGARFRKALYGNEKVQKNIERLLPIFDRKGLLDAMD